MHNPTTDGCVLQKNKFDKNMKNSKFGPFWPVFEEK